jgi:hypothetical protein
MEKQERKLRIVARGETSNHCHVLTGNCAIAEEKNKITVNVEDGSCIMKHLLEDAWMQGQEVWTKEHEDIKIAPGKYEIIRQVEYDPYEKIIKSVQD